jgi:signal transduction histidine kinase
VTQNIGNSSDTIIQLQALVERDKTALAREIHDELGEYLIAASMDVAILKQRFLAQDEDSSRRLTRIDGMLNAAIDKMRRMTDELHPTLLDDVGLFAALRWQMKQMCRRSKVVCTEDFPEVEPHLSTAASIALFRVGQEVLIIAENRAGVTRADFTIAVDLDSLAMRVFADGVSLEPTENSRGFVALAFLRHRLRAMHGEFTMELLPAGGIVLTAKVLLANALKSP